jgi:hypothetical protein
MFRKLVPFNLRIKQNPQNNSSAKCRFAEWICEITLYPGRAEVGLETAKTFNDLHLMELSVSLRIQCSRQSRFRNPDVPNQEHGVSYFKDTLYQFSSNSL